MNIPPFEEFFVVYGYYHNNLINKSIHIACIPLIYLSTIMLMQFIPGSIFGAESLFCVNWATALHFFMIYVNVKAEKHIG